MSDARVLWEGLAVGESPRWHLGRLWFAHWGESEVLAYDPEHPGTPVPRPSGSSRCPCRSRSASTGCPTGGSW